MAQRNAIGIRARITWGSFDSAVSYSPERRKQRSDGQRPSFRMVAHQVWKRCTHCRGFVETVQTWDSRPKALAFGGDLKEQKKILPSGKRGAGSVKRSVRFA